MKKMITEFKAGNNSAALQIHLALYPLFKKLFMAPNPVPVKATLAHIGLINEDVRQPLVTLDDEEKKELFAVIDKYSL
jgi:4-hydroxy-tetrahydrodipicolinate synthase